MPKWKNIYESGRKYKVAWEKEFPWIKKDESRKENAYCKLCKKTIAPRKAAIVQHSQNKDHHQRANAELFSKNLLVNKSTRPNAVVSDSVRVAELEIAICVCCHSSLRSVDHFGELMQKHGTGSDLGSIKLHRTKCSRLIDSVIAPCLKEELKEDLCGKRYALLLDESTDIATEKHLCVCVRFFSKRTKAIKSDMLGLIPIISATGEALFRALNSCLCEYDLSFLNCIGVGSDGASNMIGIRNSVWSRIQLESPNCVLFKCICHSLSLCVEKAFEGLPLNLGFLMAEVPAWFSRSTIRRAEYKTVVEAMTN